MRLIKLMWYQQIELAPLVCNPVNQGCHTWKLRTYRYPTLPTFDRGEIRMMMSPHVVNLVKYVINVGWFNSLNLTPLDNIWYDILLLLYYSITGQRQCAVTYFIFALNWSCFWVKFCIRYQTPSIPACLGTSHYLHTRMWLLSERKEEAWFRSQTVSARFNLVRVMKRPHVVSIHPK